MNVVNYLFHSLRYFVVMVIGVGLTVVVSTYGVSGITAVFKLIGLGILMNGAVWLFARWAIRSLRARQHLAVACDEPSEPIGGAR
ncbi:MAG: hypothetical protein WBB25_15655 [Sulfitobacter sp.]